MPTTATKNDTLRTSVHEIKEDLNHAAGVAGKTVRAAMNSAGDELTELRDRVGNEIRSNPVQSSAIALGIGVLLGILLRR